MTAPAPIFQSYDELKAYLGLSGVTKPDSVEKIDAAVRSAKTRLWRDIGKGALDTLRSYPVNQNPVTDAENLRELAAHVERLIVRRDLLETMPIAFKGQSANFLDEWNAEGAFRNMDGFERSRAIKSIEEEIGKCIDLLKQTTLSGESTVGLVSTFEEDGEAPAYLGADALEDPLGIFRRGSASE